MLNTSCQVKWLLFALYLYLYNNIYLIEIILCTWRYYSTYSIWGSNSIMHGRSSIASTSIAKNISNVNVNASNLNVRNVGERGSRGRGKGAKRFIFISHT